MSFTDVAAYQFKAELLCRDHILDALPTGVDEAYDGWADLSRQPVEHSLSELAYAFGINRDDECTFDSDEFPKRVLSTDLDDSDPLTFCTPCRIEMES